MKSIRPLLALAVLTLAACFPVDLYHKTGATMQRQQADLASCQAKALRDAPIDNRTGFTPRYYVPERRVCKPTTAVGQDCRIYGEYTGFTPRYYVPWRRVCKPTTAVGQDCRIYGGYWEGGEPYTYDANEALREKVQQQCMTAKGYAKVRLPQCERDQIAAAGQISARMPRLTKGSCVAKGVGGGWVVIAP